jgi:predicted GTPase
MNPDNWEWERVDENMILVMGLTGAGKSYFIQQLTGMNVSVGYELKACMAFPSSLDIQEFPPPSV